MRWVSGEPVADGVEVDAAEFISVAEFMQREELSSVYIAILEKALRRSGRLQEIRASPMTSDIHLNLAYL